jgi:hypothetical protein
MFCKLYICDWFIDRWDCHLAPCFHYKMYKFHVMHPFFICLTIEKRGQFQKRLGIEVPSDVDILIGTAQFSSYLFIHRIGKILTNENL